MNQKANDSDKLIESIKEKLKVSNKRKKILLLTLTLESWSLRKTAKEFKVSKATTQKARILREENGILAVPQPVIGKRLSEKTVNSVLEFYQMMNIHDSFLVKKTASVLERMFMFLSD